MSKFLIRKDFAAMLLLVGVVMQLLLLQCAIDPSDRMCAYFCTQSCTCVLISQCTYCLLCVALLPSCPSDGSIDFL